MTEQNNDPFKTPDETNYLAELVGEGKKFSTVDDLAKGKWHSDTMIETLKAEINALKEANANGTNMTALLDEIKKLKGNTDDTNGQTDGQSQGNPPPQDFEEMILNTLNKTKAEEAAKTNRAKAIDKMNEVWGNDAAKELKKTAATLGVSVEYLNDIATQSADAFFAMTGLNSNRTPASGTSVPRGTVNFESNSSKVRDAKYYRELKQSNPKLYKDSKVQVQMHRDALALGETFFN